MLLLLFFSETIAACDLRVGGEMVDADTCGDDQKRVN